MVKEGQTGDCKVEVGAGARHAVTTARKTEPLSVPLLEAKCDREGRRARGSAASDALTFIEVPSRRGMGSDTRSVLSDAREGRTPACASAPLKVLTLGERVGV